MEQNTRIDWIDIAKGVLIILIVIGHLTSPFGSYIYVFHVPAFFFLSGYTSKLGKPGWLKKKFFDRLMIYYIINILMIFVAVLLCKSVLYSTNNVIGIKEYFKSLFLYNGGADIAGATWFIVVLFVCEIIANIIFEVLRICHLEKICSIVLICVGMIGYSITQSNFLLFRPLNFDLGMFSLFFYSFGMLSKEKLLLEKLYSPNMTIFSFAVIIFLGKYYQIRNNWPTREFDHFSVMITGVMCGVYLVYIIATVIDKMNCLLKNIIIEIGLASFPIMVYHFSCFKVLTYILYKMKFIDVSKASDFPTPFFPKMWMLYCIVSIMFITIIARLAKKNRISNYIVNGKGV